MKEIEGIIERKRSIEEVKLMKPLVWAYIGDCIYEIFIRMKLVNSTHLDPHRLHIETIKHVKAKAQAETLAKIQEDLTEEEKDIVRRGRNAEAHHQPKNANLADYKHATAFEALIGYLYLSKQDKRLQEILEKCYYLKIKIEDKELTRSEKNGMIKKHSSFKAPWSSG